MALDLPRPEDSFDEKLISDIHEYGWHCILVSDEHHPEHAKKNAELGPHPVYEATFVYTVGLSLSYGHPELILVGRWKQAHGIVASAVSLIEAGERFAPGDESENVVGGYPARFGPVSPSRKAELLTYVSWVAQRRPFEALQLILPDKDRRWPWDESYSGYPQPLLA